MEVVRVRTLVTCVLFVGFQRVLSNEVDGTCAANDLFNFKSDFSSLEESIRRLERQVEHQSELIHKLTTTLERFTSTPPLRSPPPEPSTTHIKPQTKTDPEPESSASRSIRKTPFTFVKAVDSSDDLTRRTLYLHRETFFDQFKFLSIVRTNGEITALKIIFLEGKLHAILGDRSGKVLLVESSGDIIMEKAISTTVPIMHFEAFSMKTNLTAVLVTHENGEVNQYYLETAPKPLEKGLQVLCFDLGPLIHAPSDRPLSRVYTGRYDDTNIAVYLGYKTGDFEIVRLNGSIAHTVKLPSQILAIKQDEKYTVIGHEVGMTLVSNGVNYDLNCTIPKGTRLKSLVYDADRQSRAYGVTTLNEIVFFHVGKEFKRCFFKQRMKLKFPSDGEVVLTSVRGYLIVSSHAGVGIFNVTLPYNEGLVHLSYDPFTFLGQSFGMKIETIETLLVSAIPKKGGMMTMHFSNGVIAFFQSRLPIYEQYERDYGSYFRIMVGTVFFGVIIWKTMARKLARRDEELIRKHERSLVLPFENQPDPPSTGDSIINNNS